MMSMVHARRACMVAAWLLASVVWCLSQWWNTSVIGQQPIPLTADAGKITAIEADVMYTMSGPPTAGMVLVQGGKIIAVGEQLEIPAGSQRMRVHALMPGLVDASSSAGIDGGAAEQTSEVTPEINVVHAIDWRSRDFLEAVDEGITTLHILPGTANVFAGGSCVVKSAGAPRQRVMVERAGCVVAVCSDPTSGNSSRSRPDSIYVRQPTNRMGVIWIIRARFQQIGSVATQLLDPPSVALRRMLAREEPLFAVCRLGHDILSVLTLQREFDFYPIVVGGEEAYRVADELADRGVPVIYQGMTTGSPRGLEGTSLYWNTPGKLEEKGIEFCLGGGRLLEQARFAARFGLSEEAALAAITSRPARLLNVNDRVGSIAVGMDADLIGFSGPPLEFTTQILWTMVNGQVMGK